MNQETHSDGIDENPDGQLTLGRWITQCELNNTQDTRESAAFYAAAAWLDESVHERRRRSFGLFQSAVGHLAVILSTTLHYWRRIPFKICFGLNFVWRRKSQSDGYQPHNLGDDDSENAQQQLRSIQMILQWQKLIWKNDFLWALSHFHQLMAYTANALFSLSVDIIDSVWQILRR